LFKLERNLVRQSLILPGQLLDKSRVVLSDESLPHRYLPTVRDSESLHPFDIFVPALKGVANILLTI